MKCTSAPCQMCTEIDPASNHSDTNVICVATIHQLYCEVFSVFDYP